VFSFLIAVPTLVLVVFGVRASRASERQLSEQQMQAARLADAAIATAIERTAAQLDRLSPEAFVEPDHYREAGFEFPAFLIDKRGVLSFPSRRIYFGPIGDTPEFLDTRASFSTSESELIREAQAKEAQKRRSEAIKLYTQARANPTLHDWANLALDRLAVQADARAKARLLADPRRAQSRARTPEGIPLAIVASIEIEYTDPRLRAQFVPLLEQTLNSLRKDAWWLNFEERRSYDAALRGWLYLAGISSSESSDPSLDELARLETVIRRANQRSHDAPRFDTEERRDYLIVWTRAPRSTGTVGAVLSGNALKALLDNALQPVFQGQPFTAALVHPGGRPLWNALGDGVKPVAVVPLASVEGVQLDFTGPSDAWVARNRWITYGYVFPPIIMLVVGLAMTARMIRQEVALNELQSKFIAAVSHELKSPLTGIRLLMERIAGGRLQAAEAREYHTAIGRETDRLEKLVNRLLESHAIQSHRRAYSFEPASLDAIANASLQRLRHQAEAKGIRLVAQTDAGLPEIRLDKAAIGDAIENLLDNAIKYSPPNTEVSIHVRSVSDEARIEVSDRGIGIARADIPHIFDLFYRGRRGDMENVKGTGLGLALVKAAAEAHGGAVDVTSAPDEGSTFTFRIPMTERT
jgi:signal transduction histidine kinase